MADSYTNPLSLTSQFFFCGLPLRLDSYRGCGFQCSFCFARFRGGNAPQPSVIPADPGTLRRVLEGAFREVRPIGLIGQFLRRRVPVHFGGMSDPFQHAERSFRVTEHYLEALRDFQYPTVVSTRSPMAAAGPYLGLLKEMKSVVVQFSFTSTHAGVSRRLEPHSPAPGELLDAMERLTNHGVIVTCRWQPYIRGLSETPRQFVRRVAGAGARHVAVEHLKLPIERAHRLWGELVTACPHLWEEYARDEARRDGREYILPARVKLPTVLEVRDAARQAGVSLGVADNDLQYLSDSACCCSGVDQFPGFGGWFKHQIAHAVRRCRGRRITYGSIATYWTPEGSVDRWLNSHSRLKILGEDGGSLEDHIRVRWNDPNSPFSPASFYGVVPTDEFTAAGFRVYDWHEGVLTGIELPVR
jgi:DNA repair photolyase